MSKSGINILLEEVEIPDIVQQKADDAFSKIRSEEGVRTMRKNRNRDKVMHGFWQTKAAAVIFALMLGGGGATAAAAGIYYWNQQTAEHFHSPSAEVVDEMVEKGIVVEQTAVATDEGVTISVVESVRDDNNMYLLLNVETESPILDENSDLRMPEFISDTNDLFNNIGSTLLTDGLAPESSQCYFEIAALKTPEKEWPDELTLKFDEFAYYTYENGEEKHVIEGDWKLTIPLTEDTEAMTYCYELGTDVALAGIPVTVNYVEVSPISMNISLGLDDYERIVKEVYGNAEDTYVTETRLTGVVLEDGTIQQVGSNGSSAYYDRDTNEYVDHLFLSTMIQSERVEAILLGEEQVRVDLK